MIQTLIITESTTFIVPVTGTYLVIAIGKGGNGGRGKDTNSDYYSTGGGGGAGGVAISKLSLTQGTSYAITIDSTASRFGSLMTANAGGNGEDASKDHVPAIGIGGTATGGNIANYKGGDGIQNVPGSGKTSRGGDISYPLGLSYGGYGFDDDAHGHYPVIDSSGSGGRGISIGGIYDENDIHTGGNSLKCGYGMDITPDKGIRGGGDSGAGTYFSGSGVTYAGNSGAGGGGYGGGAGGGESYGRSDYFAGGNGGSGAIIIQYEIK